MRDLSTGGGGDSLDVDLVRDQTGKAYEIVTAAAFDADEVGQQDGFPEYGTFLKCRDSRDDGVWVELPADLETKLVEEEKGEEGRDTLEGAVFRVVQVQKSVDGNWLYTLEWFDSMQAASESLTG